ncbi:CbtA family protein [Ferrovibrio sp.]|uniref:CbtA family protein n=1 Tax=Ferrovibrio sp. TaxID=1917215 RepID=UPI003D0E08C2
MTLRLILAGFCGGVIAALALTLGQHILELPLRQQALLAAGLDLPPPSRQMDVIIIRNLLFGFVFSTLLAAVYTHRAPPEGRVSWREAALWGLAGFIALALAPGLTLPPTIDGLVHEEAPVWWLVAMAGAALGLGLLAFGRRWRWLGLPLLLAPPLLAPESAIEDAPEGFLYVDLALDLGFWLLLGLATAWVLRRMNR